MALKTGYLNAPPGIICRLDELKTLPHNRVIVLSTGSQGEPTSALVRMANRDPSSRVQIVPGDTVVISATPIPGNEALVSKTTDSLFRQGANVIYDKLARVHVHGLCAMQEDLRSAGQLRGGEHRRCGRSDDHPGEQPDPEELPQELHDGTHRLARPR